MSRFLRRRGKEAVRFKFDVLVESVVIGGQTSSWESEALGVVWKRHGRRAATGSDPRVKGGVATWGEVLSMVVTLYRDKQTGAFAPKAYAFDLEHYPLSAGPSASPLASPSAQQSPAQQRGGRKRVKVAKGDIDLAAFARPDQHYSTRHVVALKPTVAHLKAASLSVLISAIAIPDDDDDGDDGDYAGGGGDGGSPDRSVLSMTSDASAMSEISMISELTAATRLDSSEIDSLLTTSARLAGDERGLGGNSAAAPAALTGSDAANLRRQLEVQAGDVRRVTRTNERLKAELAATRALLGDRDTLIARLSSGGTKLRADVTDFNSGLGGLEAIATQVDAVDGGREMADAMRASVASMVEAYNRLTDEYLKATVEAQALKVQVPALRAAAAAFRDAADDSAAAATRLADEVTEARSLCDAFAGQTDVMRNLISVLRSGGGRDSPSGSGSDEQMQAYEALLATHADQESRWQAMVSAKDGDIARLAVELRRVRGEAADLRARNLRLERTVAKAAPNQRRLALRFTRLEAELATLRAERASGRGVSPRHRRGVRFEDAIRAPPDAMPVTSGNSPARVAGAGVGAGVSSVLTSPPVNRPVNATTEGNRNRNSRGRRGVERVSGTVYSTP